MFKIGQSVELINQTNWIGYTKGKTYEVVAMIDGMSHPNRVPISYCTCFPNDWELVEEKPQFDLKKNPWFIRTGTKEKSEAAQKWLFEQGVHWWHGMEIKDHGEKYLTNADSSGVTSSYILQGRLGAHASAQEIILEFETVVKSVTYPIVESEQDKKIKELKETIDKAQQQLEEMMGNS